MSNSPDDGLVEEQFPVLNDRFYRHCPSEHFDHRLRLLVTFSGRPEEVLSLFSKGVTLGEFAAGGQVDLEGGSVERFVVADAEVLWHHAAEALMRAYLAHRDLPPCPWLEIARLRRHQEFKKRVTEEIRDAPPDELEPAVARVFAVTDDPSRRRRAFGADLDTELTAATRMLRRVADRYLDHSNVYNAAKHGLAVVPGEHGLRLGPDDGEATVEEHGPAINYLEIRKTGDGERRWHNTITWMRLDQIVGSVYWMNRLLDTIWNVGRFRYVEARPFQIHLPSAEIVDAIDMHAKRAISVPHFPLPLQYWAS